MDRSRFYELIDESRDGSDPASPSAAPDDLRDVLDRLEDGELVDFVAAFEHELVLLNRWPVWAAGYVAGDGMGDDGFHYFRSWIIGKGEEAVAQALEDPDGLVDFLRDGDELENEELEYVGIELLEERDLERPDADDVDGDPSGEEFDEDTVEADFPRLAAWAASRG